MKTTSEARIDVTSAGACIWQDGTCTEVATEVPHKDVTCLAWGPTRRVLALGTTKGCIVLHHADTGSARKEGAVHIHSKPIRRVAWIDEELLITASDDRTAVLSDCKGDTIENSLPFDAEKG